MLGLARHCDYKRIQWVGTALTEWSREHTLIVREMNRYMPIYGTVVDPKSKENAHEFVRRPGPDASTGISIVASQADVLLTWVEAKLGVMTNYYRQHYGCKIVCVSHSNWPLNCIAVQDDSDFLTAVSQAAKSGYRENTTKPIEVLQNGVDIDRVVPVIGRTAFRDKYKIGQDDIVLTYMGRFSNEKNPLAAAQAAYHMGKQFTALYVGGGDPTPGKTDEEWLPELERVSGGQYRFVGQLDNVGDALAASDVLINASNNEGFCLAIAEAWLAGLPVVATQIGGVPEVEAIHGPMVTPVPRGATSDVLAGAVAKSMSYARCSVVDKARRVAWNEFTSPAMAERWTQYIEKIYDSQF